MFSREYITKFHTASHMIGYYNFVIGINFKMRGMHFDFRTFILPITFVMLPPMGKVRRRRNLNRSENVYNYMI